jgi:hypothetical protein
MLVRKYDLVMVGAWFLTVVLGFAGLGMIGKILRLTY